MIGCRREPPWLPGRLTGGSCDALNPKAFIYCVAIVPMDIEAAALGIARMALLVIKALTGSIWLLLGGRLSGGKRMADAIAGAALIVFALLLVRPLMPLS
ncbi:MAG: hypothetical protein E5W74_27070, partial [Mesorhizobium sp.]